MVFKQKIIYGTRLAWVFILLVVAANELLDLPALIFNAPRTPINHTELYIELVMIFGIAFFIDQYLQKCLKRIKYLEGFHSICAYCKKVKIDDAWVPIEEFLSKRSEVTLSHGFCWECLKEHYPETYEKLHSRYAEDNTAKT